MPAHDLRWPLDPWLQGTTAVRLDLPRSNLVLDLHGPLHDPQLVLFMAGNQFRALPDLLQAFGATPQGAVITRIFHATLPPGRLLDAMAAGGLAVGNLLIDLRPGALWPDVFMAGPRELQRLRREGRIDAARHYASNRGAVLLVRAGNPLGVRGVADLARDDVRVAISSPEREPASFESYRAALDAQHGSGYTTTLLAKATTVSPQGVHHREVPQLIADGMADAAPLFRHLAEWLLAQMLGRFEIVELPRDRHTIDALWAAPVLDAPRPDAARAWCDFLVTDAAGDCLRSHGLDAPLTS